MAGGVEGVDEWADVWRESPRRRAVVVDYLSYGEAAVSFPQSFFSELDHGVAACPPDQMLAPGEGKG